MFAQHGLTVTIQLSGVKHNYKVFRELCRDVEVAAVVKADAYGCGLSGILPTLWGLGCRTYFVAHLHEGILLRNRLNSAAVYVLNGLLPGSEAAYRKYNLRPVITSQQQLDDWCRYCRQQGWSGGAALHLDTGINRLGFRLDEVADIADLSARDLACFDLILSHFACADEPQNPRNTAQIDSFTWARRTLCKIPKASLASSAGCFLGPGAHFDMVRPGVGLFGGNPFTAPAHPFKAVAQAFAPLLQIKLHRAGEFVGYGSGTRLEKDTLVGTISVGYADGLPRAVSGLPLRVYFQGVPIRILGRISMDMTLVDLTSVGRLSPQIGDDVEIFGPHRDLNAFARSISTIPNEVLTALGKRASRRYVEDMATADAARNDARPETFDFVSNDSAGLLEDASGTFVAPAGFGTVYPNPQFSLESSLNAARPEG